MEKKRRQRKRNALKSKKEANSMNEEKDVSNRHMTWWRSAWWIRVDSGPHMRTARGRRRIWRAAIRAAEQACDDDRVEETRSPAEEAEGGELGKKKGRETDQTMQRKRLARRIPLSHCKHRNSNNHSGQQQCVCSRAPTTDAQTRLELKELVPTKGELLFSDVKDFSMKSKFGNVYGLSMWTRVTLSLSCDGQPLVNVVDWTLMGAGDAGEEPGTSVTRVGCHSFFNGFGDSR